MSWDAVIGHDRVREAFARAIARGRLAHGYLFSGPPGVGKRRFAQQLAKSLLCEDTDTLSSCDRCPACVQVDADTHPDFFTLARPPEKNEILIDLLRELCRGFALKAARGRGKVAILDDADDLNEESANCFLKTLEEPPPRSLFILIGTSADRQRATVVSRCQVVRFAPLTDDHVADILRRQGINDENLLRRVVRLCGGSPGQALTLADPALWNFRGTLLQGMTASTVDSVGLARQWFEFCEEAGKETAAQRRRAALVLRLLMAFLKDALALAVGDARANSEDAQDARSLVQKTTPDQILHMLERCLEAEMHLDRYVQISLVLEGLLDSLGQTIAGLAPV